MAEENKDFLETILSGMDQAGMGGGSGAAAGGAAAGAGAGCAGDPPAGGSKVAYDYHPDFKKVYGDKKK